MKKHDRKKEKKFASEENDAQNVEKFKLTQDPKEKIKILSEISRDRYKIQALEDIPENELYMYIAKLNEVDSILQVLSRIENLSCKKNAFTYLGNQLKGNAIKYIQLLAGIDFQVHIPYNMAVLNLNNLNGLTTDILTKVKEHISSSLPKFKINDNEVYLIDKDIAYTFEEMFAIISKMQELIQGISDTDSEQDKFEKIYSRITKNITYDEEKLEEEDKLDKKSSEYYQKMREFRHDTAGLYGGLINGKSECAGYALILHEALQYVGLKSKFITAYPKKGHGHAWNQVRIDGKWYNCDPTWDAVRIQKNNCWKYALKSDEEFCLSHGRFQVKNFHLPCKNSKDISCTGRENIEMGENDEH